MSTRILLGPLNELHTGVHGALIEHPPAGLRYVKRPATHYFLLPKGTRLFEPLSPHRYFHLGEFLHFDEICPGVHASRFPVLHRSAWVMDLDDFGYPFIAGRSFLNPQLRRNLLLDKDRNEQSLQRVKNMVFACSHPSCQAVLFRTATELRSAEAQISAMGLKAFGRSFLAKSRVVYPAQAPLAKEKMLGKWKQLEENHGPLTIIFCGRDYVVKNGELALQVFVRLLDRYPAIRIIYIGRIPQDQRRPFNRLLKRIEHFDNLPRSRVLAYLAASHVLFHPSSNESLGTIYLEAFAAGLAVIGAYGRGLRHIPEILSPEGARVIDFLEGGRSEWMQKYVSMIGALIESPGIAKRMGLYNYDLVASRSGKFSMARRDKALRAAYGTEVKSSTGLRLEELPHWKDSVPFSMETDEVQRDCAAYAREIGFTGCNLVA